MTANNSSNTDPIGKAFGISPLGNNIIRPNGRLIVPDVSNDFEHARANMYDLIEKGTQILGEFSQVASSAQEPRHYEVITALLTTLIDAQSKLLDLKKKDLDIRNKENGGSPENGGDITNNNLFVGSTAEFQEMIEAAREKRKIIDANDED